MNAPSVELVYFSPTHTTRAVLEGISRGIGAGKIQHLDLTLPGAETIAHTKSSADLVIIGAPVYTGRVSQTAVNRLSRLKADKTPAVIVVVYGNRAYEDALLELKHLAEAAGFYSIAAGAFIGEHSFATEPLPIAYGRPDEADFEAAVAFGRKIHDRLNSFQAPDPIPPVQVPGNFPYRERTKLPKGSPTTTPALCILCGTCAGGCPTGAISVGDAVITDVDSCIYCCACVKNCPEKARVLDIPALTEITVRLNNSCGDRKTPEFFI